MSKNKLNYLFIALNVVMITFLLTGCTSSGNNEEASQSINFSMVMWDWIWQNFTVNYWDTLTNVWNSSHVIIGLIVYLFGSIIYLFVILIFIISYVAVALVNIIVVIVVALSNALFL